MTAVGRDELLGRLALLVEAVRPLMDPDYCEPFASAWEFDPHSRRGRVTDAESVHGEVRTAWEAAEAALARNAQATEIPTPEETRWLLSLGRCETVRLSKNDIELAEDGTPLVVNEKGQVRGWLIPPYPPELVGDSTD